MFTPSSERGGVGVGVTPPPPTTPASYSSASARVAAARRRSGLFTTPGARRSPFGTPGRSTPLNRSLQTSQLVETSGQYAMESYGSSLPTLVMEALNFADRNVEISAVLSEEGWAWLVCGRRLLVWRYRQEESRPRLVNHQFRELTLPPSDLAHRAQLVVVYTPTEGQVPSCIAASPEGFVRYWATITHEASYCEVSTELQGQECESLVSLGAGLGCLLATTTSTTLLLQPSGGLGGGQTINVRHLKAPAGLLGGISRRVSSLMFGSMPTQAPEARLVRAVGVPGAQGEERAVLVLSANSLQKWYLAPGQSDRLVYECNVEKHIRESFVDHVWGRERAGATQLRVWLVDMQPAAGGTAVMILTAAVNPQVSQQLVYALATMETGGSTPPSSVSNFSVLKHSEYYQDSAENVLLAQRFLLCGTTAYIYNKNTVLCVSVGEGDSGDRVEFSGASDSILGVGRSQRLPLFFSANHGIVSITPTAANTSAIGGLINESLMEEGASRMAEGLNLTMGSLAEGGADQDKATRLQAAFLHYNKGNVAQSQLLLDDLFPGSDTSQLDSAVLQLSIALLDDSPATDPRWAEALKGSAGGTIAPTSLIVLNQLRDKTTAHQYFINFLQQMGLWQQLSAGVVKDTRVATKTCLAEHGQRLAFATALRNLHNEHQDLVDSAIKHVVAERGEVPKNKLTYADLFYRRVSQVEDIIAGVLRAQEEVLSADVAPRDAVATIHSVNKLLLALLHTARAPSPTVPASTTTTDQPLEHVPWTAARGAKGTRTLLLQQHQTTVQVGLVRAEDSTTRSRLYGQLVDLADFILGDYQPHLQSLAALPLAHDAHQALLKEYRRDRYNLIAPLVEGEQYDQAVSLAEKYCDFRTLVEVCDRTNNQERLTQYMNMFGSEGFSDFVFRWYLETGKRGKLLSQGAGQQGGELARFLQDYSSLAWLHQINTQDFSSAHSTLRHLAQEETTYLSRKKTLLSLSKLCSLVSGGDGGGGGDTTTGSLALEDDSLSLEEELIHYQEQLPESVLSAHFLDPDTMRVLSPTELVHMYTSEDNISANEFDFKKALDLLSFVGEEESEELRRLIWVRALQKNTWEHLDTDNPLQALSDTIFFRTVELAFTQGCEVRELLVPVEEMLACEELEKLCQDANFTFLLRAGYEHIDKLLG
ncbi:nuclear pore complex protein Nup133-like isoform X2 [Eriocheir sinensis]|uniref:nuclear pore complex protein Nup133-like isoform X2 n=1 Tax=Eriocheir sinensis TaxID=95602 RepID=UPI0021CAC95C|nr:nuclear pore complex protein Nup133-like isoform X2 [Eriocheir sinensis]